MFVSSEPYHTTTQYVNMWLLLTQHYMSWANDMAIKNHEFMQRYFKLQEH